MALKRLFEAASADFEVVPAGAAGAAARTAAWTVVTDLRHGPIGVLRGADVAADPRRLRDLDLGQQLYRRAADDPELLDAARKTVPPGA